ncbi:hypothetical protein [Streptomyces sp. NPDC059649]|uniref:hypothetical protein n=1 Tax=Streptomyces sp. NPDC059649 TaxID=3346895 RepID=UPI00367E4DC0
MTDSKPQGDSTGLEIALQWAQLPAEHLKAALDALEPELARQHQLRVIQVQLAAQTERERRAHLLYLGGLVGGFLIVVAMLSAAVIVGINGLPWLSGLLAGPSVLSLAGLFVLRRVDSGAARNAARAHDAALNAASQPGAGGVV